MPGGLHARLCRAFLALIIPAEEEIMFTPRFVSLSVCLT